MENFKKAFSLQWKALEAQSLGGMHVEIQSQNQTDLAFCIKRIACSSTSVN